MNDLYLHRDADRRLRGGHLWVYSNEVDGARNPLGNFSPGDRVLVRDSGGNVLGSAYMDPHSLICGRLYAPGEHRALDEAFCNERLQQALALREAAFDQPFYRLVYGDSDGLPGVVVDRFAEYLVLQLNNAGIECAREALVAALGDLLRPAGILLRRDIRGRREQQDEPGETSLELSGAVPDEVPLTENGAAFLVPVRHGQKTGWFYDHRLSRARLAQWAPGRRLLDVYSYTGAWGIQAAVAGAAEVVCVDSSASALAGVEANAALNKVESRVRCRRGQAAQVMEALAQEGATFDIVVLDPPAFVQRKKDLKKGIAAYRRIVELALRLVRPGGLLVSASCSMHLSRADLIACAQRAAVRAGCNLQIIEQGGQGPDHPVHPAIPETEYLKTLFLRRV
ncbi:MAG: class I SAM-dependent rRNA methyltransferase [Halioglobus sp.]|nr:class I SAM-dependent rRNA methyltransferase [Halioglobus sp.]